MKIVVSWSSDKKHPTAVSLLEDIRSMVRNTISAEKISGHSWWGQEVIELEANNKYLARGVVMNFLQHRLERAYGISANVFLAMTGLEVAAEEKKVEVFEMAIKEAIRALKATRRIFQCSMMAAIRRGLESALKS